MRPGAPCFECLRARENATMDDPDVERACEYDAAARQSARGAHVAMARIVGEVATFEIDAALTLGSRQGIGHVLEVAPMRGAMTRRPVLRVPRCSVCSSTTHRPPPALSGLAGVDRTQGATR